VRWYAGNYVEIEHMTSELLREVERRKIAYESLSSTPKDIERYNILAGRENAPELPIIVVVYDEFSALMHRSQAQQKRILSEVLQLALRARKYGIFLIIAGQTFKADLIDSAVLGQFSFNVAFHVRTGQISLSILGQTGAEKLMQPGEALVKIKDGTVTHIQALYIDDDELLEALEDYRDPENRNNVPALVRSIVQYAHEHMDDQVKFRELELHLRDQGISRAELIDHVAWMDEHKFTVRGSKNNRVLNWRAINGDA
jgi:S-DNA-T family DNA segregation ATPase FtsK/SpoIIIE